MNHGATAGSAEDKNNAAASTLLQFKLWGMGWGVYDTKRPASGPASHLKVYPRKASRASSCLLRLMTVVLACAVRLLLLSLLLVPLLSLTMVVLLLMPRVMMALVPSTTPLAGSGCC